MPTELVPEFIVIDDDPVNNMICVKMLRLIVPEVIVSAFTNPQKGIEHIHNALSENGRDIVLFLDLDMPSMSGWETLGKLAPFSDIIKSRVKIFILTSSADPTDKKNAEANSLITAYMTKPLSPAKLKTHFPAF